MQKIEVLIVGQGLAGSLLALELEKRGRKIHVVDNNPSTSSSKVAAGLYNPITGIKMTKTWMADELFPNLGNYYEALEKRLHASFHERKKLYRLFNNMEEQNDWSLRTVEIGYDAFIKGTQNVSAGILKLNDHLGGFYPNFSGVVDVKLLVEKCKEYLVSQGLYTQQQVPMSEWDFQENQLNMGSIQAEQVIFCEGPRMVENPLWTEVKHNLVKGEILDVKCSLPSNQIFSKGIFIIPKQGYFRVGSTYDWNDQIPEPTAKGKRELLSRLGKLYLDEVEIINHQSGIRPASFDRRPFVGFHNKFKNVGIFNGFGSKGVSLIPYFANQMADHICFGKKLPDEVNPNR